MSDFEILMHDIHAVWTWMHTSLKTRNHALRHPTVITSAKNIPTARTMVLREIMGQTLIFFTDRRSNKVVDITQNTQGCIHAYTSKQRIQVLLYGEFKIIKDDPNMQRWRSIGLNRFSDYGSHSAPGTALITDNIISKECAKENFTVIAFYPNSIELLKLHRERHKRVRWEYSEGSECTWNATRLVP